MCNAQSLEYHWVSYLTSTSGNTRSYAESISKDVQGNINVLGMYDSNGETYINGDSIPELSMLGSDDIYVKKIDANGELIWANKIGNFIYGSPGEIANDESGNIYITAFYSGDLELSINGAIEVFSEGTSFKSTILIKISPNGEIIWAKNFNSYRTPILVKNDEIYLGLNFADEVNLGNSQIIQSNGGTDILLVKLSTNGSVIYYKQLGSNSTITISSIDIDQNLNLYTTGYYFNTIGFQTNNGFKEFISEGENDIYVMSLTNSFDIVWLNSIGTNGEDQGNDIEFDQNNIYLIGNYYYDIIEEESSYSTGQDMCVLKYNINGDLIWSKFIYGVSPDNGEAISVINNTIFIGGKFEDYVDFDPSEDQVIYWGNFPFKNSFFSALDLDGNYKFAWVFGHGSYNGVRDIITSEDEIYLCGSFGGITDFDPTFEYENLTSQSAESSFVLRLSSSSLLTNINHLDFNIENISIYPNPTNKYFKFHQNIDLNEIIEVKLYSNLGKLLKTYRNNPSNIFSLPEESLDGIYFLEIIYKNSEKNLLKIIVNK